MSFLQNITGQLYIGGTWQDGLGPELRAENPANLETVWQGEAAAAQNVDAAIKAARSAFRDWARLPLLARIDILQRYQSVLRDNKDDLATAIHLDSGKPLWEAATEAAAMIGKIDISIRAHETRTGTSTSDAPGATAILRHRPHGVVAVFGPYNFPGHLANGHIVPALIAGNCVVFKPSELTPLTAEFMTRCFIEAGLPAGVINLVQGARDTGISLANHDGLDGLFFTGSARTGQHLHQTFAGQPGKILALELGGNNPLIAWDIKDRNAAARMILQSAYISAGQRCTCARRLILQKGAEGDAILDKLGALIDRVETGPGENAFMGPLFSNAAADQMLASQEQLINDGGKALRQMQRPFADLPFLTPGLIDVTAIHNRADEELFGPLLQVIRLDSMTDAMTEANNTRFGLAAGLLSDSDALWQDFLLEARAGIVNRNRPLPGASSAAPFGGIGASGNHRPSAFYAADYCAWPMASLEADHIDMDETTMRGLKPAEQQG